MAKKPTPRIPKVIVYQGLALIINKQGTTTDARLKKWDFPRKYHAIHHAPGKFQVLYVPGEDSGIVAYCDKALVASDLQKFCQKEFAGNDAYQLTPKQAAEAATCWLETAPIVELPKPFLWPEEPGLGFTRLPWPALQGNHPTWSTLLNRMHNSKGFMAWIGSLFEPESYLQQYVWLYGNGNDGKGCINRFLARIFGPAYCSKQPRERGDKFWAYGLLGKRIVVFPDCNDQAFVAGGFFKTLTGADPIDIEAKGQMSFTTRLGCKYLVFSNEKPLLSSETADGRRIIYCELAPREDNGFDSSFEDRLWAEGGAFLYRCLWEYKQVCPKHEPIPVTRDKLDEWIETVEAEHAETFDAYFIFNEKDDKNWLPPEQVQRVLKHAYKSRKSQLEFLQWLERTKCIKKVQIRVEDGKRIWRYRNLTGRVFTVN